MRIVVIGSTGQLGQDLMRILGPETIGLSHQDLDVCDKAGVAKTIEELKPDWVINTAAYNRVDDCESDPGLAEAVNARGAGNVCCSARTSRAGVVFFSTDYVFDGKGRGPGQPYEEHDTPHPLNVYGASKLYGERLVMPNNPRHLVIRTSGLFGTTTSHKGWTFPELILERALAQGNVRVVSDQVISPTFSADLAAKVKELILRDARGLFHVTNSGECSWFDFAREVLLNAGGPAKVEPIKTAQLPQQARRAIRPPYSALKSSRLAELGIEPLRPWQEALKDYLVQKGFLVHPK